MRTHSLPINVTNSDISAKSLQRWIEKNDTTCSSEGDLRAPNQHSNSVLRADAEVFQPAMVTGLNLLAEYYSHLQGMLAAFHNQVITIARSVQSGGASLPKYGTPSYPPGVFFGKDVDTCKVPDYVPRISAGCDGVPSNSKVPHIEPSVLAGAFEDSLRDSDSFDDIIDQFLASTHTPKPVTHAVVEREMTSHFKRIQDHIVFATSIGRLLGGSHLVRFTRDVVDTVSGDKFFYDSRKVQDSTCAAQSSQDIPLAVVDFNTSSFPSRDAVEDRGATRVIDPDNPGKHGTETRDDDIVRVVDFASVWPGLNRMKTYSFLLTTSSFLSSDAGTDRGAVNVINPDNPDKHGTKCGTDPSAFSCQCACDFGICRTCNRKHKTAVLYQGSSDPVRDTVEVSDEPLVIDQKKPIRHQTPVTLSQNGKILSLESLRLLDDDDDDNYDSLSDYDDDSPSYDDFRFDDSRFARDGGVDVCEGDVDVSYDYTSEWSQRDFDYAFKHFPKLIPANVLTKFSAPNLLLRSSLEEEVATDINLFVNKGLGSRACPNLVLDNG